MYYSVTLLMLFYNYVWLTFQRKCPRGKFSFIQKISCDLHFLFTRYKTLLKCFPRVKTGNWSNEDKVCQNTVGCNLHCKQNNKYLMPRWPKVNLCVTAHLFQWVYTSSKVSSKQSQAVNLLSMMFWNKHIGLGNELHFLLVLLPTAEGQPFFTYTMYHCSALFVLQFKNTTRSCSFLFYDESSCYMLFFFLFSAQVMRVIWLTNSTQKDPEFRSSLFLKLCKF